MTDHIKILRRVGWLLVVVGTLDIGVMIYCIANQIAYSSSLNVFAVVAGVFLLRGSLEAVRYVTWFSAFMFSGLLLASLFFFPWFQPMDYWLLVARKDPFGSAAYVLFSIASLSMLLWIYSQLRLPAVVEARAGVGHKRSAPESAFIAGAALAILLAAMLQVTLKGQAAQEAIRLASKQYGGEYRYFVSSINWSSIHVSARVTAYNEDETKEVEVEWDR